MSDFARLREHLRTVLFCAPLVAGACAKETKPTAAAPKDATPVAAKTPIDATAVDAAPAHVPPPATVDSGVGPGPVTHDLPRCPSGSWCGSAADAKTVANGKETALGCPVNLKADSETKSRPKDFPGPGMYIQATLNQDTTKAKREAGEKNTCCYDWFNPCPGGRPLLAEDRPVVAAPVLGAPIAEDPEIAGLSADVRQALADGWLADALAEHASVASFARATIELLAVGAPPELVADAQRAGLDEVRHAERCFALAARCAGRRLEPGPLAALAPRESSLARLAADTFAEGCVGETISTLAVERALGGCVDPVVAKVLRGLAKDEARHAALAWRTVAWAISAGGDEVREAVRARAEVMRVSGVRGRVEAGREPDGVLAPFGRLDAAAQTQVVTDAWNGVILPTLEEVVRA